jgi:hypothetical protein
MSPILNQIWHLRKRIITHVQDGPAMRDDLFFAFRTPMAESAESSSR